MTKRFSVLLGLMLLVSCVATAVDSGTLPPAPSLAEMVLIPAGSFQMGDGFGERNSDELPVHTVMVSAFYMDTYEVTKALWDEVVTWAQANGYDIPFLQYTLKPADGSGNASNHPVCRVSWYEVVKWANARSEKEGLAPCYYPSSARSTVYRTGELDLSNESVNWTANGYRLPTEAEWEKAARGEAVARRYPWGDSDEIDASRANYDGHCNGTTPVGSFAPNGYGLYDMAGNVREWCWDWYDEGYYASSPGADPRGPLIPARASGPYRVFRGGSWGDDARYCRVAMRDDYWPVYRDYYLGFRLVRTAP